MSEHTISSEITFAPQHESSTKRIWKTFWVLSVLTIIELGLGYLLYYMSDGKPSEMLVLFLKGVICILTLAKAYYIVSIFMHLGDEVRNMIMTIVVPLTLFIWFIIAFLWDGNAWRNLRNTNAHSKPATEQVAPAAIEKGKKD